MALIAGAGNPTGGSNPAGTGTALNYLGEHAYAYSGSIGVTNTETTLLDFNTGSNYIVGNFEAINGFNGSTNDDYLWLLSMDDQAVMALNLTSSKDLDSNPLAIIIPPFTRVIVTCQNVTDTSSHDMGACITGRVY